MDSSYEYYDSSYDGLKYSYDTQYDTRTVRGFGLWCKRQDRIVLSESFRVADHAFEDCSELREIVLKLDRKEEYKGRKTIYYEIAHDSYRGVCRTDLDMKDAVLPPPDEFYFGRDAFRSSRFTGFGIPFFMKPEHVLPCLRTAPRLYEVYVSEQSPYMKVEHGVVFSKDMTRLLLFPMGKWYYRDTYDVPSSVTRLTGDEFAEHPSLEKITVAPTTELPKTGLRSGRGPLVVEIREE